MDHSELFTLVDKQTETTELMVAEAKLYVCGNFISDTSQQLHSLLKSRDCSIPESLDLINKRIEDVSEGLGKSVSWWNAGVQALCSLQGQGLLIPSNNEVVSMVGYIQCVTGNNSHRQTGGIDVRDRFFPAIRSFMQAPAFNEDISLLNSDIYLKNLSIPALSKHISVDLSQAVQCFRAELYLPCITMLGRAMEGSWIQLGESIYPLVKNKNAQKSLKSDLDNVFVGIAGKINSISEAYKVNDNFGALYEDSSVSKKRLNAVRLWSDQIREYRNAIHPAATASIAFNYQNVSVILLSVKDNFEAINHIVESANKILKATP